MTDAVMSCYYTTKPDPQRQNRTWQSAGHDFREDVWAWYESVERFRMRAFVLYDELPAGLDGPEFFPGVQWVKITPGARNPYDDRFIQYLAFIEEHKEIDYWMTTDITDVIFMDRPFGLMHKFPSDLFVGSEVRNPSNEAWLNRKLKLLYNKTLFDGFPLLNCGILGGHRNLLLPFLELMKDELLKAPLGVIADAPVLNHLAWKHSSPGSRWPAATVRAIGLGSENPLGRVYTGYPLHSQFKADETNPKVYIKHK
jgi:hypothetical protein